MENKAVVDITVVPKSSQSRITIDDAENIKVYLNSPPVEGMANRECILLFSKKLKIAKSKIEIEKGEKGRRKRIAVYGLTGTELIRILKS